VTVITKATEATDAAEARSQRPRALIVTVYGAYGRELGGWISVANLIALMSACGVDEPAVRSSISRLKRRGILTADRREGAAGYSLSEAGREILTQGDHRIFERHTASLEEGWVLAVFSVPESERQKRHALRSRLTWLGFGNASSGVWIAPAHLYDEVREALIRLDLAGYVNLFRADYLAFTDLKESVASWWDLESLRSMYDEFLATYTPVLARWEAQVTPSAEAFGDYVRALTDWRRLPFLDPGLPPELLPADWPGSAAADLFARLEALLHEPGLKHVTSLCG
jgi:phenylacetic acid degradation operon negative regulatory protein